MDLILLSSVLMSLRGLLCGAEKQSEIMADCLPRCNEADVNMGDFPFSSISKCPLEFCCEKLVIKMEGGGRRGGDMSFGL